MRKEQVRNLGDAFLYILDCQLATVSNMAMLKSRSQYEFKRQKAIAQTMVDWARTFELSIEPTSRAADAIASDGVEEWANLYDVKVAR
jgi:hypothetical protein